MRAGDTITDGGVVWRVIDSRVNGFIGEVPNFYERSELFTPNRTTITTPTKMMVNVNGKGYIGTSVTLNLNSATSWDTESQTYTDPSNRAGMDFYIYVCDTETDVPVILLSANATVPTGYNAANSRKVGGFHCLCLSVGTIEGHQLSGYLTGDILPLSVWDLKHRPKSDPEGMVYVAGIGRWYDIYLASWDGNKLVSKFGGTVCDGSSTPNWHGEKFAEYIGLVGKQLMFRDEFQVVAKGSNECTNIYGSRDYGTTGAHVDTNNRRMISHYGLEDCCGYMWQWTRDLFEYYPGADWRTGQFMSGYQWVQWFIYNSSVDSQECGFSFSSLRRPLVGGVVTDSYHAGTRCIRSDLFTGAASDIQYATARGCSDSL